ncbi:hypothetical protein LO763_14335 [Glycomyces sp. A-F 0318]|uniref:hypothetical protein n=1 Tax=Glycomyces amatae TaxID=2881355 RepID=UPI001E48D8FF|nr:hypothetical protein [Glycomyces amatae]MCD0444794.1 hypothetical protein [Glycomyces amatae]
MQRTTAAGLTGLAVALAATAACTDDPAGGGDAAETAPFDEVRLVDMVNESARLLYELESAENRIVQDCLEREGFAVHDRFWFTASEPERQEALFRPDDWGSWLPEPDEAAEFGLGSWTIAAEGRDDPDLEAYYEYKGIVPDELGMSGDGPAGDAGPPDNGEFDALSPQEQYDWYTAYFGEATAVTEYGHLVDAQAPDNDGGADGGEIDLGDDFDYVEPEPGGCRREMIDALYGDGLELVQDPEGQEYREAVWTYRPANPVDDFAVYEEFDLLYRERMAEAEGLLVDCLAERGHPGWEFGEEGSLPLSDYFWELYEGEADVHDHPDLPDDVPGDYEGRKAFEIAFAVELAACGDETGFRETAEQSWADTQNEYYLSIETAVYAWQDEVRDILTTAQDLLEG